MKRLLSCITDQLENNIDIVCRCHAKDYIIKSIHLYGKTFSEPFFSVIVVFATTSLLKIIHSDLFIARIMEFSPG